MASIKISHLIFGGLVLLTAIPSLGGLRGFSADISQARLEAKRIGQETTQLQLAQQEAEQKAAIAEARYESGCVPVVTPDQRYYAALIQNRPVVHSITKAPLPVGSVVCDANGNTAVIVDDDDDNRTPGVVQQMAFTGDKELVDKQLRMYKGASFTMPTN